MREMVAGRLERVEEFADGEVQGFIRKAGAKYDTVSESLVRLGTRFDEAAKTVKEWRDDIRRELAEHDARLLTVEDKSTRHTVRLDAIEDTFADHQVRVRSLERHQTETTTELALTRRQKTGLAAVSAGGGIVTWLLSHLLGG